MSAQDPAKRAMREQLMLLRRGLTGSDIAARSLALTVQLLGDPLWTEARGIAAFVGVRNEPDTTGLIERSLAAGKAVWLPRLTGPGRMAFWPCSDLACLVPGRMGLREPPVAGDEDDAGELAPGPSRGVDLMLVPGLGFGRDGARIGFGAGHYDRALASQDRQSLPVLVGVCFAEFLDPSGRPPPTQAHDVAMDWVLTELGLERCTR